MPRKGTAHNYTTSKKIVKTRDCQHKIVKTMDVKNFLCTNISNPSYAQTLINSHSSGLMWQYPQTLDHALLNSKKLQGLMNIATSPK
jgi:membrane protease subunit (stomatin/prohibitin family)